MSTLRWPATGVLLFLLLVGGINAYIIGTPPAPVAADASASEFSSGRAFEYVKVCAQRPHPIGSADNARIRDYIIETLRGLGYDPQVQHDPIFFDDSAEIQAPENIYAKLPGSNSTGTIMILAHYDSVPFGPAAADDIAGIAAILETARALKAGPPPRNDIMFFFSDGEERAGCGPVAFLQSHPWRKDVKMAMNFESRGTCGPSMMFHTNARNGGTIREFLKAAPYPVSSSSMFDIAGRMPTSTDYWQLKEAGIPGFDFAFVGNLAYYHTANDTPEHLDQGSLQHHGSYALALARHFGGLDLNAVAWDAEPVVYFNTLGHQTVYYTQAWIWPISLASIAAVVLALVVSRARRRAATSHIVAAFGIYGLCFLLTIAGSAAIVYLGLAHFSFYAVYNQPWYVAGFFFLTTAIVFGTYSYFARGFTAEECTLPVLLFAVPFIVAITIYFPLCAYFAVWPVLATAIGVLFIALVPERFHTLRAVIACAASVPALLITPPNLLAFFDTVTFVPAPIILLGLVSLFGLLLPALDVVFRWRGRTLAAACFLCAALLLTIAVSRNLFTPEHPKMDSVDFAANFDTQQAHWASLDRATDEWTSQLLAKDAQPTHLEEFLPLADEGEKHWSPAAMPRPTDAHIDMTSDDVAKGHRLIKARVYPGHNTAEFSIIAPPGITITSAKAFGREFGKHEDHGKPLAFGSWYMHYLGRAEEGIPCEFEVGLADDFKLTLIETAYGLPEFDGAPYPPRPDYIIPETNTTPTWSFTNESFHNGTFLEFHPDFRSDRTFLRKTFDLTAKR